MDQPKRVLIIQGHPDASERHLCHGLAESYAKGAREAGFEVNEISIATIEFTLLRSKHDFEMQSLPTSLTAARDAITASDHIVLVFPLWLGTMPALLKARAAVSSGHRLHHGQPGHAQKAVRGPHRTCRRHDGNAGLDLSPGLLCS
jgi:NAD(P)H-dependent FMN reductase